MSGVRVVHEQRSYLSRRCDSVGFLVPRMAHVRVGHRRSRSLLPATKRSRLRLVASLPALRRVPPRPARLRSEVAGRLQAGHEILPRSKRPRVLCRRRCDGVRVPLMSETSPPQVPWSKIAVGLLTAVGAAAATVYFARHLNKARAGKMRGTYRYFLQRRRGGRWKPGVTSDPRRRRGEHRGCSRTARMRLVGPRVTRSAALRWERAETDRLLWAAYR
jgi:hypothetical protein